MMQAPPSPDPSQSGTPPPKVAPVSQDKSARRRAQRPAWLRQMPRLNFPPKNDKFQLIGKDDLVLTLSDTEPAVSKRVMDDWALLSTELMPLFRQFDYEASLQQNRYRLYQISFIILAALATVLGSLQALALGNNPYYVPIFAFAETLIALVATFLATISGREPPFESWMRNRQRAEVLRRDYFRYLTRQAPYDRYESYQLHSLLRERMASINSGSLPTETADIR